jgi:hypothetical protein
MTKSVSNKAAKAAPAPAKTKAKAAPATPGKTTIRPDVSQYVKGRTASGKRSFNNGDAVASTLNGLALEDVYTIAEKVTGKDGLEAKYSGLNPGQQRMTLGNLIRATVRKLEAENAGTGERALEVAAKSFVAARDKALAAAEKAKAKAA